MKYMLIFNTHHFIARSALLDTGAQKRF